jgi:N utilization substance protein B
MVGGIGSRREARERALALLYEAESRGVTPGDILDELPLPPQEYARELCVGVQTHRVELDAIIERLADNWSLERMPLLDVTVLRIGLFELAHRPDVPVEAVLSEAVNLAAEFSTSNSGPFVNGVLRAASRELRELD